MTTKPQKIEGGWRERFDEEFELLLNHLKND